MRTDNGRQQQAVRVTHDHGGAAAYQGPPSRVEPVRVALIGCTGVLGDIIRRVVGEAPDMRVVADASQYPVRRDGSQGGSDDVDVVLWNNADEEYLERLLAESVARRPPVLTALNDGRQAVLWQLVPHRNVLGVLSSASLAEWIRSAATR